MARISPPSHVRSARRTLLSASVVAGIAALASAGGCSNELASPPADLPDGAAIGVGGTNVITSGPAVTSSSNGNGTTGGNTTTSVASSSAGTTVTTGNSVGTVGTTGVATGTGGMQSVGTSGSSTGSIGSSTGGTGVVPEPCEDRDPGPRDDWPGATCENWATESDACNEAWFAEYCDISCGRCVPEGGLPPERMPPDCSDLPQVSGGDGFATRYWDCCQPHCAQFDGHRCNQDGTSRTGDGNSACSGGGAFACYDEAPHAVSECLSYGHIAKANPNCGGCYRIQFTGQGEHNANDPGSKLIKGKQMIVKVTNTGSDVGGNQFDLMIPGGGVGQFNACSRQWGTNDLGAQYGGFLSVCTGGHSDKKECVRQHCMKIPAGPARDGCIWFVDWFEVADNPKFTSQPTDCPF